MTDAAGGGLGGVGGSIPFVGALAAVAGMALKIGSSLSGMYQNAMQSQESTLFAFGEGYVGGGGGVMRNSEFAQAQLARARLSESGTDRGNLSAESSFDVKFGLQQGIGGMAGVDLIGRLKKYGAGQDPGSEASIKRIMSAGAANGMDGFRQAEFMRRMVEMGERNVQSGFGNIDIGEQAEMVAGVRKRLGGGRGSGDRAFRFVEQAGQSFAQSGSNMQNLVIANTLAKGGSYMEGVANAEKGATKENLAAVSKMLNLEGMDSNLRSLYEHKALGATGTEAYNARDTGGIFAGLIGERNQTAGEDAYSRVTDIGDQSYIRTANQIDQAITKKDGEKDGIGQKANSAQVAFTNKMTELYGKLEKGINTTIDGFEEMRKKINGLSKSFERMISYFGG